MSKTFKCPYCDYHGSRQDLVEHIDDEHDEMIPEGFSPVHLVFDIVNGKKDHHGVCVVCKRDTEWDENASKYKRLCGRKQCAEALRDIYKKNMLKVHGKITLLNDPEQQEKMLANRGISGKVQFDDKGFHTYTGSYERKLLEFENSIGFKSSDILSPGPTIEYDYKGEKHKYITDQMIIPFNLIIEVKDGGGNTNNRINDDSRDRTIAKEIAITKLGKYNYLRLTNNSFDQLLETLAELKAQMVDDSEDNKKVIININEEVEALKEASTDLNAVFNGNDIYIRVDEFKAKKLPILFITGMSGGGKTTLAKKIVEQQKCTYIEIDAFSNCQYVNKKDHPWLFEYLQSIGKDSTEDISNYCKDLKNMSRPDFEIERAKYIKWVVGKASNSNQVVIEGVQVPNLYKDYRSTLFTKYAMILKGTSLLISFLRRIKRDKTEFLRDLPHFIGRYIDWYESQNHLRKDILQDDSMGLIKESESQDVIKTLCGSSAIIDINEEVEALKEMLTGEEPIDMRQFEFVASPSTDGGERAMNSVVMVNGKQYRARVETLIIKDGKIYAQKQDKINKYGYAYKIPGGSIEPDITLNASAQKECNEEARIIVKDLKYSGISYAKSFNGEYPEWHKKKLWPIGLKYEGSLTYIFVGYYGQQYKDKVDKIDYDDLYKHAKFYTADELDISPEHEKALKKYGIHRTRFDD